MSGGRGRRLSEAEKPAEEDENTSGRGRRGSGSGGWGIRSTRPQLNLEELEGRQNDEGKDNKSSEGEVDRGHISEAESGHGDGTKDKKLRQQSHKPRQPSKKKKKERDSPSKFLTSIQSQDSEEIENFEFVNFQDLPKLPKIDSNVKGQFVGSSHKFERPITGFRIRVRLLKYPSVSERAKWPGDFLILEERTFCWQEKVFSKSEADKYLDKKGARREADEEFRKEIRENPACVGTYLHSYIDSDYFVIRQEEKTLVKKCSALHFKTQRKFSGTSAELKSVNSDGESIYDGDTNEIPSRRKGEAVSSQKGRGLKKESEEAKRKVMERQKKEDERRRKADEELAAKREKAEEKQLMEALKKSKKELEAEQKQIRYEEQIRKEEETRDEALKKYLGTKRPSVAISARMLTTQSPSKRLTRRALKTKSKKLSETSSKDRDGSSPRDSSSPDQEQQERRKSEEDEIDKGQGVIKKSRVLRRPKAISKSDSHMLSDDGEYEELTKRSDPSRNKDSASPKVAHPTKSGGKIGPIWRVAHRRFLERSGLQPPQSMYIMATIPHMNRRKGEICVCAIKAYQKSGIVVLKPPFGYRIIEAKRNHVYRLSWELYLPNISQANKNVEAGKLIQKTFSNVNLRYPTSVQRGGTVEDMTFMFDMVPLNEMRLFVMGEIVSAEGFEAEPLCVHYLVEMPKGWRNDSVASSLEGVTHSSFTTDEGTAHFSQDFFFQLAFSMDSVDEEDTYLRPMLLLMVVSLGASGRVRYEGYAYINVPSTPGSHLIKVQTWKPKPRTTMERMQTVFLDVSPSLQDMHDVHIPVTEHGECSRGNRLGLQTEPSGFLKVRLNVIQQVPSSYRDQSSKLDLLEKMSSATILKSVQAVIEAFQRARKHALNVKSNPKNISNVL